MAGEFSERCRAVCAPAVEPALSTPFIRHLAAPHFRCAAEQAATIRHSTLSDRVVSIARARRFPWDRKHLGVRTMNYVIYLVGLIVVVGVVLSFVGLA